MLPFLDLKKITACHEQEYTEAIQRVLHSGWFLQGEENKRFETRYAEYIGTRFAVGVGNGLDALHLIYRAYIELGVMKSGDEVIVPANTFIASILALTENQLVPVLVEPRFDTLELDEERIEEVITAKTRSILLVHLYGRCAYTEKIGALCRKYDLKLVEDNAQAHGCKASQVQSSKFKVQSKRTGALGDAAGHSFYPGKNLGAFGDAGAVTTNDPVLADTVRALANYGSVKKYVSDYQGRNSRMDEIQAAVLNVKLNYLNEDNAHRQEIAHYYYEHIKNPLIQLPVRLPDENNVYHIFPVFCEQRDRLQEFLREKGIQTLIHYPIPPHQQTCYIHQTTANGTPWHQLSLPVTERIHRQELSLPISPVLTLEETSLVTEAINSFVL